MPRTLVVDDEADMRWLMGRVLRDHGLEVVEAEDGEAALKQITREPPDVILLDLKMPGLDGIQVLEQAKALYPHMLVVIVTAYGDMSSAVQAMRLGACDYVTKPFDNDEILFRVRRALETRELEAARLKAARVSMLLEAARAVSHEINNPLALILGHAEMLEKDLDEPSAARRLRVIIGSCERIARAVQRLSSIVEPVTAYYPGVGSTLDLDNSVTGSGEPG